MMTYNANENFFIRAQIIGRKLKQTKGFTECPRSLLLKSYIEFVLFEFINLQSFNEDTKNQIFPLFLTVKKKQSITR
jgi:hypothetical protein